MITAAKAYTKESASDEKWNAFQEAIKTAEDVYNNESATQDQIDQAVAALREAIDTFKKRRSNIKSNRRWCIYSYT